MTITEFLLARIAEDEAVARDAGPDGGDLYRGSRYCRACHKIRQRRRYVTPDYQQEWAL